MKSYEVDEKPWGSLKKKLNKDNPQETAMAVIPLRYRKLLDGLSPVSAKTSRKTSDSTDSGTRELAGIDNPAGSQTRGAATRHSKKHILMAAMMKRLIPSAVKMSTRLPRDLCGIS